MKRKKVLAFMAAMVLGVGSIGSVPVYAEELEIGDKVIDPETGTEGVIVESPGNTDEVLAMMEEALESGTIVTGSAENTVESLQARAADTPGNWKEISSTKWKWIYPDGTYAKNAWICVKNQYYYIGSDQYMKFGWMLVDGEYYYAGPSGAIYMNCGKELNGKNCNFNPSGHLVELECWINAIQKAKTNWCWAAAAEMVGTYGTSSPIDQWDIVYEIKGSYNDWAGNDTDGINGIEYASQYTKKAYKYIGFISVQDALKELVTNQPFKLGVGVKTGVNAGGAHALVIYGLFRGAYEDFLKYVDPDYAPGDNKDMKLYQDFKENEDFVGGDSIAAKLK